MNFGKVSLPGATVTGEDGYYEWTSLDIFRLGTEKRLIHAFRDKKHSRLDETVISVTCRISRTHIVFYIAMMMKEELSFCIFFC